MRTAFRMIGMAAALSLTALALGACGFRPLYAKTENGPGVQGALARVAVQEQRERVGFDVRSRLVELLSRGGGASPAYDLAIKVEEREEGLAIEPDTSVTRYNFELTGFFVLRDRASGKVLTRGSSKAVAAYNVVDSQFATEIAKRDVRDRAARTLGEDIHKQLAIYFDRFPPAPATAP